jgi:ribosomal-protein-alanine N-acetyltransferase
VAFIRSDTVVVARRAVLMGARRSDFAEWSALRRESRSSLEPWEPRWPKDALSRSDWYRRVEAWNKAWKAGTGYVFLIRRACDNTLLGGASLTQVRAWPANAASLGYWIGAPHAGQGYMREAVKGLCDWAFPALRLARIEAAIVPGNDRSRRVLEAAGFAEEGYAKAYLEIAGTRRDHILFALVSPDIRG